MYRLHLLSTFLFSLLLSLGLSSCTEPSSQPPTTETQTIDYVTLELPEKPNILWLVAEDLSPYLSAFGDSTIPTPNLDRLAREGVRYSRFFSPSGVCAPSRAAIALGMYPTRVGAMHMRTGPWWNFYYQHPDTVWQNRRIYEALPPTGTHMHSELLRRDGYYTSNNPKEDYQFRAEMTAWDESNNTAHWRNRPVKNQPFFSIFNFGVTHESQIWSKADDSLLLDPETPLAIPPYLPDTETVRTDLRRMYSNIAEMDQQVGEILQQLENDGLLDNTIIFWYGDHGGPLPRSKRTLYDTGIRAPLIVRFPNQQFAGQTDGQLLSFIDLKPTLLSITNNPIPDGLDGKPWLGAGATTTPRKYIHAAADDFDGCCHDRVRIVRDNRFKLIKNYMPDKPYYLPVTYREQMASMKELLKLHEAGQLNAYQDQWFRPKKDSIELFDTQADPFELKNIATNPEYADKLKELKTELKRWVASTEDKGMMTENEYLSEIWPGGVQPKTQNAEVKSNYGKLEIRTETNGAAIGYQWISSEEELSKSWKIYTGPIAPQEEKILVTRAHRIGYLPSETLHYTKTTSEYPVCLEN